MNRFVFHALLWLGWLGFAAVAGAQSAQLTAEELTAKADQMGQQTFTRKSGEVLTFQKINELPSKELDVVLDDEMSEAVFADFDKYITSRFAAANALADEAKKLRDIATAEADKAKKLRDIATAEADKAEAVVVQMIEQLANKMRQEMVRGIRFDPQDKVRLKDYSETQFIIDGLKPETLSFLKSVLARPELFRDK